MQVSAPGMPRIFRAGLQASLGLSGLRFGRGRALKGQQTRLVEGDTLVGNGYLQIGPVSIKGPFPFRVFL
jgi:hypothetical protein